MKILYLSSVSPRPLHTGGALRVEAIWHALRALGDTALMLLGPDVDAESRRALRAIDGRVTVLPPRRETGRQWLWRRVMAGLAGRSVPVARAMSRRRLERLAARIGGFAPDTVVVGNTYLAELVPMLRPLTKRVIVETCNVESLLTSRIAAAAGSLKVKLLYRLLAANTAQLERRYLHLADEVWAVSDEDAAEYRKRYGLTNLRVVPNVLDLSRYPMSDAEQAGTIAFCGHFAYWPNQDAALRLIETSNVLAQRGVKHELWLVGRDPTPKMRAASRGNPRVVISGVVPAVSDWIGKAAVVAAPLTAGSGTKYKLLEAMALGRPVVTSIMGAEGLMARPGDHLAITHPEPAPLADMLAALLADAPTRRRLGAAARRHVERHFSLEALARAIAPAFVQ